MGERISYLCLDTTCVNDRCTCRGLFESPTHEKGHRVKHGIRIPKGNSLLQLYASKYTCPVRMPTYLHYVAY